MNTLAFQETAINELRSCVKTLWSSSLRSTPITFKSPTGSGKTFMVASLIEEFVLDPEFQNDKCYIWITFSDELAMQSLDKFKKYFGSSLKTLLLTVDDIGTETKLDSNSVLFVNWQKLTQSDASARQLKLRKPSEIISHKESGIYFDDFIENTQKDGREIIFVIDESHKNSTTVLAKDIIDFINPKLIINVSATPESEPSISDIKHNRAGYVEVLREDVVAAGLIREKIILQTQNDVKTSVEDDFDLKLLDFGFNRREALKNEYVSLGKNINPLMIIQLPNDDATLKAQGSKTKEEIVLDFLRSKNVDIDRSVALWFDKKKTNLDLIDESDSDVDFMLFKQAAGTGWDCPRAQVLVMFREIQKSAFYVQTVGRILRMSEPDKSEDYKNNPNLRYGYLYTNYHRTEVQVPEQSTSDIRMVECTTVKEQYVEDVQDFNLQSDAIPRTDYGDLINAAEFQKSFIKSLNSELGINDSIILDEGKRILEDYGIDINPTIVSTIITDLEIKDFDNIVQEIKSSSENTSVDLSQNDIAKTFDYYCAIVLKEQTDDKAKVSNISRSWGALKTSLRVWFQKVLPGQKSNFYYAIFIADLNKGANSKFKPLITKALVDFFPKKKELIDDKANKKAIIDAPTFVINKQWCYDETYNEVEQLKCVLTRFYLKPQYKGRENETAFATALDGNQSVKWWLKNGDAGLEYFALRYFNTKEEINKLFYPDWIVKFSDGRIGIFDTKSGNTLNTEGRASALAHKIIELGDNFIGGIVRQANGIFEYCCDVDYDDVAPKNNDWKPFSQI